MPLKRPLRRALIVAAALIAVTLSLVPAAEVQARVVVHTRAGEATGPLLGSEVRPLPFAAGHVALYWTGNPDAVVTAAFSTDGVTYTTAVDAGRDEIGEQRGNGVTYGSILAGGGATSVRVSSDRPLGRLTALALADGDTTVETKVVPGNRAGATVAQPAIVSRSDWGADETLRFDSSGNELWPPTFHPVQKLIVHHTAGANGDTDPAATIRSIYYYHAKTQGWDDIGYNFLIDESGRIYKGRHSHPAGSTADTVTGEDADGRGVTAAHAYQFNSGTVGVALLGTLTTKDATPAAKSSLVDFLAWKADAHAIDPNASSLYVNPVSGNQKVMANIAGHRDVEATECPGGGFYATLPEVRAQVAARMGAVPDTVAPSAPSNLSAVGGRRKITLAWTASSDSGGSGLVGYEVFRSSSATGPFTFLAQTSATTYTNSGLTRGKKYWYQVKAYDAAGNRSGSATVTATAT